jgi:transposase
MEEENLPYKGSQQIEILEQLVEEDNDATIKELSDRLAEKTSVKASISTICRCLQRRELTRKKNSTR